MEMLTRKKLLKNLKRSILIQGELVKDVKKVHTETLVLID
jgi:hypothetical protein